MVRRTSFRTAECPVARSLEVVGDCWSLLIVRDAGSGLRRFSEFEKSLGVAKNILAARLRHLVAHQIMKTAPASDGSTYLEYVLTSKGDALSPLLGALRQWGEDFYPIPSEDDARANMSLARKLEACSGPRSRPSGRNK